MKRRFIFTIGLLCVGTMNALVAAQGIAPVPPLAAIIDMERVRALYGAAAYEEALAAMPAVNGEAVKTDLEQYRALCLLALGREPEAVTAIERLVRDNPMFLPPAGDTSPRMRTIFASVRSKLVPGLAKRAYGEAKAAYESKNRDAAHAAFQRTVELIDSLADSDQAPLSDLRLLAGEFLELSAPRPAPAPASLPESAPAASELTGEYVGPVAVREQLPAWIPPDSVARQSEYVGILRVFIGVDGRVTSATIVKGSHPKYDLAAVNAAKQWVYKPATRGGQAVIAAKEIQVRLVPQ